MRNTRESWHGKWISTDFATVSQEPEFTLEEMFSGKIKLQEIADYFHVTPHEGFLN